MGNFKRKNFKMKTFLRIVRNYGTRPQPWQMEKVTDIGSRHIFNEDHDQIRESTRKFFAQVTKEEKEKWASQGYVDREFFIKAGRQGLIGVEQPKEKGGWGLDFAANIIGMEEQIYAQVPGNFNLQSDLVMPYIASHGTDAQIQRYMPGLRDGEIIGAIAMTEPSGGSDLQGMRTDAVRDGDDYILNGSKVFISSGWMADVVLVCAITDKTAKKKSNGMSIFLVDT